MTDLTDRMRTCAARIASITDPARNDHSINDAVNLLIEASNLLEAAPAPLGEPMEVMKPWVEDPLAAPKVTESLGPHMMPTPDFPIDRTPSSMWIAPGGPLPGVKQSGTVSPRACPKCDSRTAKKVYRRSNRFVLECPVCGHVWERA